MIDFRGRRSRLRRSNYFTLDVLTVSKFTRFAFFGLIGGFFILLILFFWYGRDLPTPGKLTANNLSQSTRILDRNGVVLYDIYGEQNRTYIELKDIPKDLQKATIAIEDQDFYQNEGFSPFAYLRVIKDIVTLKGLTGGSTLTQQLVKNALLTSERTLPRKIKEFILAVQVDKKYSKDQILELYFNVAPYGGTAVGVEAASELYFGKKAKGLTLIESVILAGMPQRPSYYSPYGPEPKAYIGRATDVLRRMREDEYITSDQEKKLVSELPKVKFLESRQSIKAPHFSFYVKDLLVKKLKFDENFVEQAGLQVTTTLDYKLQDAAEKIVKEEVAAAKNLKVGNGASVVINPKSGEILAMVGSKDFFGQGDPKKNDGGFAGQFNVAVDGLRQPGSAIKPITYAAALEQGYTASSIIMDTKTVFPNQGGKDYIPVNYDGKYHGPVHMRFTLGSSLNIPAVKMLALTGIKNTLSLAHDMGLTTLSPTEENTKRFGLSMTLGGGEVKLVELASSYGAFANGGVKVEPVSILKVTDRKGNVLYEHKDEGSKQRVMSEDVAFIISHILLDNNARLITFGENSFLNVRSRTIAVKTGTTDDKRDNWTIGWTPSMLVATWVGNNDNSPMGNVASGVTGAAPIWRRIILEALKNKPNEEFTKPDNVSAFTIDAYGGGSPVDGRPTRSEYFIKGTEPQGPSSIYKDVRVSKADNNKLASDSELDKGEYDIKKFIVFAEKDPISTDGKNRWQEGIDAWIKETYASDKPEYYPPKEKSDRKVESSSSNPSPTPGASATPTPTLTPTPTPIL